MVVIADTTPSTISFLLTLLKFCLSFTGEC